MKNRWSLLVFLLLTSSCFEEEPGRLPVDVFESLWTDFSVSYPSFEQRKVNWDSLYTVYRPRVNNSLTENQLFSITREMLAHLKDGHVKLVAKRMSVQHNPAAGKPTNFPGRNYLRGMLTSLRENNVIMSGFLTPELAYVYIESWGSTPDQYSLIDQCLKDFTRAKALIIDVRGNGGGSDDHAKEVMGRFVDRQTLVSFVRYKSGPGRNELGDFLTRSIEPKGSSSFLNKPVFILTNRRCYSANEFFIVSMKSLPHVLLVGDTTGGGSANAIPRELGNGWYYTMPRWLQYDLDKKTFEGKGICPHHPVWTSKSDSTAGRDLILEKAMELAP
jgi:hypothetical protein